MSCLDNLVGIKSICITSESSSGLYIEDIGITANECDSYINSEYASGEKLIRDKIAFAGTLVSKLVNNHFASYINAKTLIDSNTLGFFQDNLDLVSGITNNYGGINLRVNNNNSYLSVFVNSISIQLDYTGDVDLKVIDLNTGSIIDTITIASVAGEVNTKFVNKTYESNRQKLDLIFVYDTTGIDSNTTLLRSPLDGSCTNCTGYGYSNYYIWSAPIYIPIASTTIRNNLTAGQHTFGVSLNYSIQCSTNNWLCEIANLMSLPILYKAGEEIMNYAVYYSKRQTSNVNIDAELNKERLIAYQNKFNESIEATLKKINLPKGDICFKCEEYMKSAIILP